MKQNSISPTAQRIRQHHRNYKKDRSGGLRNIKRSSLNSGIFCANIKESGDSHQSIGK